MANVKTRVIVEFEYEGALDMDELIDMEFDRHDLRRMAADKGASNVTLLEVLHDEETK